MELLLHPSTKKQLTQAPLSAAHGFLVTGIGDQRDLAASKLVKDLLQLTSLDNDPNVLILDSTPIKIEDIRSLDKFLSLKVVSPNPINRAVLIKNAQSMRAEAQNALLKTLEEPPKGTVIVLSVDSELSLLPTVLSRLEKVSYLKPSKDQLKRHFNQVRNDEFERVYALGSGDPTLINDLLTSEDDAINAAADLAKQLLSKDTYGRLNMVSELTKDSDQLKLVIDVLINMSEHAVKTNSKSAWVKVLKSSLKAKEDLAKSAQSKLVLENLILNL
ncbi:MAG TPA: hypothetical protein VL989_02755 [Candidatus Sulfotelmatobacter sp.]|nr:hypothetical protein [Candidatus Sulfotelmatobacter sp.]